MYFKFYCHWQEKYKIVTDKYFAAAAPPLEVRRWSSYEICLPGMVQLEILQKFMLMIQRVFYQEDPVETHRNKRLHVHIAYKYKTSKAKVDILPLT